MSDLRSYSAASGGPTVDALELKLTGTTGLDVDLRRTQEVEIVVRGVVTGHAIVDKYDKNGDVAQTVKSATVKLDELVTIEILTVPRRMRGQTAMDVDGYGDEAVEVGDMVVAVVGELEAGPRPEGVDANGELTAPGADAEEVDESMINRHAQIPEDAWRELNVDQKLDVAARMDKISAQQNVIAEATNKTDVDAAEVHLGLAVDALRDDYGIELLPAEVIEQADAALPADEPPPAPVVPGGPSVSTAELQRRRRYLLAKQGMPAEMEQARQEELEEINRRLRPRTLA